MSKERRKEGEIKGKRRRKGGEGERKEGGERERNVMINSL